jgi:hypothetical protein
MKIGVWNVRGLYDKENLLQEELKKVNVGIVVIPETKKKLKGSQELEDYILLYRCPNEQECSCRHSNND